MVANIRCGEIASEQLEAFKRDPTWQVRSDEGPRRPLVDARLQGLLQRSLSSPQLCVVRLPLSRTATPLATLQALETEASQDLATSFGQRAADLMDSCLEGGLLPALSSHAALWYARKATPAGSTPRRRADQRREAPRRRRQQQCSRGQDRAMQPSALHNPPPPPFRVVAGYDEEARYFEAGVSEAKREELVASLEGLVSAAPLPGRARRLPMVLGRGLCSYFRQRVVWKKQACRAGALPSPWLAPISTPRSIVRVQVRPAFEAQLALLRGLALTVFGQQLQQDTGGEAFVERAQRWVPGR